MPPTWSQGEATTRSGHYQEFDIEKNMYDNTQNSLVLPPLAHVGQEMPAHTQIPVSPISPIHEGITPFSSVARLSLQWPAGWQGAKATMPDQAAKKPARLKQKISRWIVFQLWFNTYRKFFTIVTLLNLAGIIMAALGRFPYAENHLGALVLGNLLCAILMRNELFLRFLYMIAIYGLRSVCPFVYHSRDVLLIIVSLVGSIENQAGSNFNSATRRRNPFGMRTLRRWVR